MNYTNYPNSNYNANYNSNYTPNYNTNYAMNYSNVGYYQQPSIYQRCTMFFSSNAFLTAAILYTIAVISHFVVNVYCLFTGDGILAVRGRAPYVRWTTILYYGNTLAYILPEILLVIFFFVCRSSAKRNALSPNNVRNISGTILYHVILVITYAVLSIVGAIIGIVALLRNTVYYSAAANMRNALSALFRSMLSAVIYFAIAGCIIIAILLLVFALCGYNGIRKFTRSVYRSIQSGNEFIVKRCAASGWLITFGIFAIIFSLLILIGITRVPIINVARIPIFMLRGVAYIIFGSQISKYFKAM